jgi:hypothetical protein
VKGVGLLGFNRLLFASFTEVFPASLPCVA